MRTQSVTYNENTGLPCLQGPPRGGAFPDHPVVRSAHTDQETLYSLEPESPHPSPKVSLLPPCSACRGSILHSAAAALCVTKSVSSRAGPWLPAAQSLVPLKQSEGKRRHKVPLMSPFSSLLCSEPCLNPTVEHTSCPATLS